MLNTQVQSLFAQGYRIRAGRDPLTFIIRKLDNTRYTVSPAIRCCTCPAGQKGVPCKHLKQLTSLVNEQWAQVKNGARYEQHMYDLMIRFEECREASRQTARNFQSANLLAAAVREVEENNYLAAAYTEAQRV